MVTQSLERLRFDGERIQQRIAAARLGDEHALADLHACLAPLLFHYVSNRTGARLRRWTEPSDIVQTVLAEVLCRPSRLPAGISAADFLRRLRKTAKWRICDAANAYAAEIGDSLVPPDAAPVHRADSGTGTFTRADSVLKLEALIDALPGSHREVVRLRAAHQLSYPAIAARLGIEADTARRRFERARDELRRAMEEARRGRA